MPCALSTKTQPDSSGLDPRIQERRLAKALICRASITSGMRKSGNRFSGAIKFMQIAYTYLPIPLYSFGSDHVYDFGLIQSKIIVI